MSGSERKAEEILTEGTRSRGVGKVGAVEEEEAEEEEEEKETIC